MSSQQSYSPQDLCLLESWLVVTLHACADARAAFTFQVEQASDQLTRSLICLTMHALYVGV